LYARRWAIETAYKDLQTFLRLGKCESRNFTVQVASVGIVFIQYNILSKVKRYDSYETIGSLFTEALEGPLEMTVVEKIWRYLLYVIILASEYNSVGAKELLQKVINKNTDIIRLSEIIKNKAVA